MSLELSRQMIGLAGVVCLLLGAAVWVFLTIRDPNGPVGRLWQRYIDLLRHELDNLASKTPPIHVIGYQLLAIAALIAFWLMADMPLAVIFAALVPPMTFVILVGLQHQRRLNLSLQLDSWLLMLANMLQATGSVGAAIRNTADLTQAPLADEIDILLKRIDVGTSLEDALQEMYNRVGTPSLRTVVTSLRIGRRLGGDLPKLLAENAASLREMQRIDGYIRSQVAQGKTQMLVLAAAPLGLVYLFKRVEPTYFDVLYTHVLGPWIIVAAGVLWIAALYAGFKIMRLDV